MTAVSRIAILLLTVAVGTSDAEPIRVTSGTVVGDRQDLLMSVAGGCGLMLDVATGRNDGPPRSCRSRRACCW
jgi:hypothetical protein